MTKIPIDGTILKELVNAGKTVVDLCSYFTISRSAMRARLKEMGLKAATPPPRKHSEEEKKQISERQKKWLADNPDKHPWRNMNRYNTIPCQKVKEFLSSLDVQFVEEFQPNIGNRHFSIDIAMPDKKIALEINGNQHYTKTGELAPYYQERHDILEAYGWIVYEIHYSACFMLDKWADFVNKLKNSEKKIDFDYFNYSPRITIVPCLDCGKKIKSRSKRCSNCAPSKRKNRINLPPKEEIQKLLLKKPIQILAEEFGIHRNGLRKIIKKMGLETPPRGFFLRGKRWKKLKTIPQN